MRLASGNNSCLLPDKIYLWTNACFLNKKVPPLYCDYKTTNLIFYSDEKEMDMYSLRLRS